MYQFQFSSELMKNQKQAQILANLAQFDALQTSDGLALFFSVGDDNQLYMYPEQQNVGTGWTPINLTADLEKQFPNVPLTCSYFSVTQDPTSGPTLGNISIAQVIETAAGQNHLFVLSGLSYEPTSTWLESAANRTWINCPFDTTDDAVNIAYAQFTANQNTLHTPYLIAGSRDATTSDITNYVVNVTTGTWQKYETAQDFTHSSGLIQFGQPAHYPWSGIYELASLSDGTLSLTFTPWNPGSAPPVTLIPTPAGASAIATLPAASDGSTNLFVAGHGGIFLFTSDQQTRNGKAVEIASPLVSGVDFFEAHLSGSQAVIWGRNSQGTLFYCTCPQDQQATAASWSTPVPIQQNVAQVASLLNMQTQASELFINTASQSLISSTADPSIVQSRFIKLTQNPISSATESAVITTQWNAQTLLLPALDVDDVIEFYSFTTHIDLIDGNLQLLPNQDFSLTSSVPVNVYVNDNYLALSPNSAKTVASSATGSVTIIQETESLSAATYNLIQTDEPSVNINPMSGVLNNLASVSQGLPPDVYDEQGNSSPLFPGSVTPTQQQVIAQAVSQLYTLSQTLPADGSVASKTSGPDTTFGLSFANNDIQPITSSNLVSGIENFGGDLLHWVEQAAETVEQFVIKVVDGVANFFITLGADIYHFVVTSICDVLHAIQFIFTKVGVAFETIVRWLGYIFNWQDILTTHAVIKSVINNFLQSATNELSSVKNDVNLLSSNLQELIDNVSGLTSTASTMIAANGPQQGTKSPAVHWGIHQLHSNLRNSNTNYQPPDFSQQMTTTTSSDGTTLSDLLTILENSIQTEKTDIEGALQKIRTDLVDNNQMNSMSAGAIIEKVLAIIADLAVESIANILDTLVQILQLLLEELIKSFEATLDIPVISWMYKKITVSSANPSGDDLSFLDLACLVSAVPATVVYKVAAGAAPFPQDDPTTALLINANSMAEVQSALATPPPSSFAEADTNREAVAVQVHSALDRWNFSANIIAGYGSLGVTCFTLFKNTSPQFPASIIASVGYAVYYLPYCAPDIPTGTQDKWYEIMNTSVTSVSCFKALIDISLFSFTAGSATNNAWSSVWGPISPWVEALISGVWMAPAVAPPIYAIKNQDQDKQIIVASVGAIGNVTFNSTAFISLAATFYPPEDPETLPMWAGLQAAAIATILCYGGAMVGSGFLSMFWKD